MRYNILNPLVSSVKLTTMVNIIYNTSFTNFLNLKILIQNKVCSVPWILMNGKRNLQQWTIVLISIKNRHMHLKWHTPVIHNSDPQTNMCNKDDKRLWTRNGKLLWQYICFANRTSQIGIYEYHSGSLCSCFRSTCIRLGGLSGALFGDRWM